MTLSSKLLAALFCPCKMPTTTSSREAEQFNLKLLYLRVCILIVSLIRYSYMGLFHWMGPHESLREKSNFLIHHHFWQWGSDNLNIKILAFIYGIIVLMTLSLQVSSIHLIKNNCVKQVILPVEVISGEKDESLIHLGQLNLPNKFALTRKATNYIHLLIQEFSIASALLVSGIELILVLWSNKKINFISIDCFGFALFSLFDIYFLCVNFLSYFVIVLMAAASIKFRLDQQKAQLLLGGNLSPSAIESELNRLVTTLNDLRKMNLMLRYPIFSMIFFGLTILALQSYSLITSKLCPLYIVYLMCTSAIAISLSITLKLSGSIGSTSNKIINRLSLVLSKSNYSKDKLFKYSYVLQACKFKNTFSFLDIADISDDFLRKSVFWVILTVIRVITNQKDRGKLDSLFK